MPLIAGLFAAQTAPDSRRTPILLLHGAGGSHLDWPSVSRRMTITDELLPVLAIDLAGHGKSSKPGRSTIAAHAQDVIALLDALHIPKAIVIGHSMGGAIGLTLALDFADRVAGLVLVGTGARLRVEPAILDNILRDPLLAARQIAEYSWGATAPATVRERMIARLITSDARVLYGDFQACNAFDVMDRLADVHAPTLVTVGAEDRMTPPKYAEYLAAHIPNAQLAILAGGGHMIMLEQPTAFAAAVNGAVSRWLPSVTDAVNVMGVPNASGS